MGETKRIIGFLILITLSNSVHQLLAETPSTIANSDCDVLSNQLVNQTLHEAVNLMGVDNGFDSPSVYQNDPLVANVFSFLTANLQQNYIVCIFVKITLLTNNLFNQDSFFTVLVVYFQ